MTDHADDVAAKWLRGVLEACVVGILRGGPAYGYEIAGRIADAGFVRPKGGTLYPILGRLEASGWVEPSWLEGDGGPSRKYYRLTATGADAAAAQEQQWAWFSAQVGSMLAGQPATADLSRTAAT